MADLSKKQATTATRLVGADPATGVESNFTRVTDEGEVRIADIINDTVVQVEIQKTGAGVTAFCNINDTVGGNLTGRRTLRIYNKGKTVRWRIYNQLTGNAGEPIGKGEAAEFTYGDNIVVEIREQNTDDELDVIITEAR